MDTSTVLEIIKIIDDKIGNFRLGPFDGMPDYFTIGEESGMQQIRDLLLSFIEETEFPDPKSACSACGSHDSDHLCLL